MTGPGTNTPANDAGAETESRQGDMPTTEDLIAGVIKTLQGGKDTDTALLKVLADNILTTKPAKTAVQNAASAIEALAAERVEGSDDDQADHD